MINRVCVEGIDGAGKTTVADHLEDMLRADGLEVSRFSPYTLASDRLGQNIYELWKHDRSAKVAIQTLRAVLMECESTAKAQQSHVVLYDRHWMTAFTEVADRPQLAAEWGGLFVPAALLASSPEVATSRVANDQDTPWSQAGEQKRYADRYHRLALGHFAHMLGIYRNDSDVTPDMAARAIRSDMYFRR